jgi:hypothetical protein
MTTSDGGSASNIDDTASNLTFVLHHLWDCVLGHQYHAAHIDNHCLIESLDINL